MRVLISPAMRRCLLGGAGAGLSVHVMAEVHASSTNPQPLTGWWELPDKSLAFLKQWGNGIAGRSPDGATAFSGTANGLKGELKRAGGEPQSLNLVGSLEKADLSGEGPVTRHHPRAVVICGPSGVGKGTLLKKLLAEHPEIFAFSVSHTTRKPRPGEADGTDYHFASKEDVQAGVDRGEFLEHAHVHGNIYGTSKRAVQDVLKQGKVCLLDIDIQGAQSVALSGIPFVGIFVKPPSWEALEARLRGRGTETEEKVQKRLKTARAEVDFCDSHTFFWFELVNDDLETTYAEFKQCIAQATQLPGLQPISWSEDPAPKTQLTSA
eukprot:Hpha_TRINITY_DN16093_c1_g1::TRINITY_DN16093_c1_g1_i1::g.116981::m.116981/K00942/E2.7.4.8, gmk; guanylate kinase